MKRVVPFLLLVFVLFFAASAEDKLTNDDIIKLLDAKIRQSLIVHMVSSTPGTYNLGTDAVRILKQHGAKQPLLDAMQKRQGPAPAPMVALARTTHRRAHVRATPKALATHASSITSETCEDDLSTVDDCHASHPTGCSSSQNPNYDAYLNFLKNQLLDSNSAAEKTLTQADLDDREQALPDTLTSRNHGDHAQELAADGMDEGKIVSIVGTLFYAIHSGKETCNCELAGSEDVVDFHIGIGFGNFPLSADALDKLRSGNIRDDSAMKAEFTPRELAQLQQPSFIVEMTPHFRENHPELGWTLDAIQNATGHKVRVTGQLMVDNAHHMRNDDCGLQNATNKCWRATIWEIHPITDFEVCRTDACTANSSDWVALKDFQ